MENEADIVRWHGKLAGKSVLVDEPVLHGSEAEPSRYKRYSSADLSKMDSYPAPLVPGERPAWLQMLAKQAVLDKFLKSEGALGMVRCSYTIGQLVHGYGFQQETGAALPGIDLGGEVYGRLVRLPTPVARASRSTAACASMTAIATPTTSSPTCLALIPPRATS